MACEDGYVDLLGDVSLEETQLANRDLLLHMLQELRIMNMHLSVLTDNEITKFDLDPHEES